MHAINCADPQLKWKCLNIQEPPFLMGKKAKNNDRGDGTTLNLSTMPKKLSEKMHEERLRKFISGERSGESSLSTLKQIF